MDKSLKRYLGYSNVAKLHNKVVDNILQNGTPEKFSEYLKNRNSNYCTNPYALSVKIGETDIVKNMLDNYKKYPSPYNKSLVDFCNEYFFHIAFNRYYVYEVMYDACEEELIFRCIELSGENAEGYYLREFTESEFFDSFGTLSSLLKIIMMTR